MNYGKDATEKRLQAANSRSDKYRSRIFLTFIKTCCVLCLFCVLVIAISMIQLKATRSREVQQ